MRRKLKRRKFLLDLFPSDHGSARVSLRILYRAVGQYSENKI